MQFIKWPSSLYERLNCTTRHARTKEHEQLVLIHNIRKINSKSAKFPSNGCKSTKRAANYAERIYKMLFFTHNKTQELSSSGNKTHYRRTKEQKKSIK